MLLGFIKRKWNEDLQDNLRGTWALCLAWIFVFLMLSLIAPDFVHDLDGTRADALFWQMLLRALSLLTFGGLLWCTAAIFLHRHRLRRRDIPVPPLFDEREKTSWLYAQAGAFWALLLINAIMLAVRFFDCDEDEARMAFMIFALGPVMLGAMYGGLESVYKMLNKANDRSE